MSDALVDLGEILRSLDVAVRPDPYVFASVAVTSPAIREAHAVVHEAEDVTIVTTADVARRHGISDKPTFAWLTLTVHSSLEAVGLTAAFSAALAKANVSCNVLAGFYHDHLLVPFSEQDRAVSVLRSLNPTTQR